MVSDISKKANFTYIIDDELHFNCLCYICNVRMNLNGSAIKPFTLHLIQYKVW